MFKNAIPVFAKGEEGTLNYRLIICEKLDSLKGVTAYVTAFSFYRLTVNGRFVAFGPARTAGGYARVDTVALDGYDNGEGENEIIIEVAGYNCCSLSTVNQTSFVVCELRRGDDVLKYTGRDFLGYVSAIAVRKTERFSGQRHFGEAFDFREREPFSEKYAVELAPASNTPKYLDRVVPMPTYEIKSAERYASTGSFSYDETLPCIYPRFSFYVETAWGCFDEEEIPYKPYRWIQQRAFHPTSRNGKFPLELKENEYVIVDMGAIETGFICIDGTAFAESDVVIGFSELCIPDGFEFGRINMQTAMECVLNEGDKLDIQSLEPYTCRSAAILVKKGGITVNGFAIRRFEHDRARFIKRDIKDAQLAKIYRAAEATFAHNAVDIYSDCPSRERAGWLCDSFFTGRVEYFLTGKTAVEDAFLENYRRYENNGVYPDGVLPMCYPADPHDNQKFIPQWDMWYVIETKEYLTERNTAVDKELFRKSVLGVVDFLERYENSDGLLQNLPSWNFVEWSTANEWVQDVNYPTNFLYAEVLRAAYALYGNEMHKEKAERVAKKTAELSFNGEMFVDNAVLTDGRLVNTKNSSEAGQYYAVLFGSFDINEEKYATLKENILDGFKNFDAKGGAFVPVNAFIGFYLRICALMKMEEPELLSSDLKRFFGGMVDSTGTLWEYMEGKGSRDHGFASYAAIAIDYIEKTNNKKVQKSY